MPTRLIVYFIVALVSVPAHGQEPIPQSFLEQLARDLAAIQKIEETPESPNVRVIRDNANVYAGAGVDTNVIAN